jgi:probable H4MPT-linked C1 transfer pathway protein
MSSGRSSNRIIAVDIGGANLKLADGHDYCRHQPFALWQRPQQLAATLQALLQTAPAHDLLAITMTGELTDCFANKKEGVEFIVQAALQAADCPVLIYLVDGRLVESGQATDQYRLAAASNWHALASWVARSMDPSAAGLLIDTGSTTTDVIPFCEGQVVARGHDDFGRLVNNELVYTGAIRSSIAGIVTRLRHRRQECPVMNELFATSLDSNVVLGHLPPGSNACHTADGKPVSPEDCVRRLSRLIGKDELDFNLQDAVEIARQVFDAQVSMIAEAAARVLARPGPAANCLVLSGQGEFLAYAACQRLTGRLRDVRTVRLTEEAGPQASDCATAWSLARLAADHRDVAWPRVHYRDLS